MKVKIKKTREIINAVDYKYIILCNADNNINPIVLKLNDLELIDEDTNNEIERRKRVITLAEKLFISYNYPKGDYDYENTLRLASDIIDDEDRYIKNNNLWKEK